ncbi:MAG: flagellar basal body L-ring protein FlgH [Armatimonadota bacterium]
MRIIVCMAIIILVAAAACADSLWTPTSTAMFSEKKACRVGDIVTILIEEAASSSQDASTEFSKDVTHENGIGPGPLAQFLPDLQFDSSQSGGAKGSTSRTAQLSAKLTATVTSVLPNGNLVLEGTRSVKTNSENQEIKLSGTVRQEDVTQDNTVLSTYLADAKIECMGKGPIGDRQKEGIISKLLKLLF